MKLGDKIIAAEDRVEDARSQIATIIKSCEDENRDPSDEETDQIEALEGEITSGEKSVRGLKTAEKALMIGAQKREKGVTGNGTHIPAVVATKEAGGALLSKMATVQLLAHIERKSPDMVIAERYGADPRVAAMHKAATEVATTFTVGWAQELTTNDTLAFMQDLSATSIYGALAAAGIAIPFGNANSVTIPSRSGSGNVSGSFVGENATIPVKQDHYNAKTLTRFKAAVISTFTEELARVSTPQIEALIRMAMMDDTGDMLDSVLMNPTNAVIAGIRPASPWNGAPTQASAGNDQASILSDLRFLLDTLAMANAGRNPRIVINPSRLSGLNLLTTATGSFVFRDELASGRLLGIPLIVSTNCPAGSVYIIDAADFATAFGISEYKVSDQTSLVMADDDGIAPTMTNGNAISEAGSINISDAAGTTPPTVVRSMFQTNSIALRQITPISWAALRPGTLAYLTAVSW